MKKLKLTMIAIMAMVFTTGARGQCPNIDFSLGTLTPEWTAYAGSCAGNDNIIPIPGPIPSRHGIQVLTNLIATGQLYDEKCPDLLKIPDGKSYSCKIGNEQIGAEMEAIEYELTVDSNSSLLLLSFAWVMENPGHDENDQPQFTMKVKDINDNVMNLPCSYTNFIAGSVDVALLPCSDANMQACGWKTVGFSLEPLIGQKIKIYFETKDCRLSGHYGYAYVVCECRPMRIDLQYCDGNSSARMKAPDGFSSYYWTRSSDPGWNARTQQINVPNPIDGEVFTCELTSAIGTDCSATVQTEIKKTLINPNFFFGVIDANGKVPHVNYKNYYDTCSRTATFVDLSTAYNSPKESITWDIAKLNLRSYDSLFTVTFPDPPIADTPVKYLVSLTVTTENGCRKKSDTLAKNYISIYPSPRIRVDGPTEICTGDTAELAGKVVRSKIVRYQWHYTPLDSVIPVNDSVIKITREGTYILEAENQYGCIIYDTVIVTPLKPKMNITLTDVSCHGGTNGRLAHPAVQGGLPPYLESYWVLHGLGRGIGGSDTVFNVVDGRTFANLPATKCTFYALDARGCKLREEVEILQPDSLELRVNTFATTCGLDNGAVRFHAIGGTEPYRFKLFETLGGSFHAGRDGDTLGGLRAQQYYVVVIDTEYMARTGVGDSLPINNYGCTDTNLITIEALPVPYIKFDSVRDERCGKKDGIVWLTVQYAKDPVLYWWDENYDDTLRYPSKNSLDSGWHSVKTIDAYGCINEERVYVPWYSPLEISVRVTPEVCLRKDGGLVATVTSDSPANLEYEWGNSEKPNWVDGSSINGVVGDSTYRLRVRDPFCSLDTSFFIPYIPGPKADFTTNSYSVPASSTFALTDISTGTVMQGDWDFGDLTTGITTGASRIINHTYPDKGEYVVFLKVTDVNNCTDTISKVMRIYEEMSVYIPNSFTPNGDGLNDTWKPVVTENQQEGYTLTVYDRWGQAIFHTINPNQAWDGTSQGKPVPSNSIYTYVVKVKDFTMQEYEYTGHVTVIR
jgi:gliding motility-associated-like protein